MAIKILIVDYNENLAKEIHKNLMKEFAVPVIAISKYPPKTMGQAMLESRISISDLVAPKTRKGSK